MELINVIKALAHENRLRILNLVKEQPLCVCEIRNILEINQSNASRHLRKLKNTGLVEDSKKAQWVYYQLNKNQLKEYPFIKVLLEEEVDKQDLFQKDLNNLKVYNKSEINCENLDQAKLFNGK